MAEYGGITQDAFIAILLDGCGYLTRAERRGWLEKHFNVAWSDQLSVLDKSRAIEMLSAEKADKQ